MPGTPTFPLDCFVGLAVAGSEVAVTGYARQPATLAYCADGVTIANTASLQWPHATYGWGAVEDVQLWDAAGTLLGTLPTETPVTIAQYDIARVPAGGIAAVYGPAPRAFGIGRFGTFRYGTYSTFYPIGMRPVGFGVGGFGMFGFGTIGGVPLERAFDQQHVCAPGTWTPGPFARAA